MEVKEFKLNEITNVCDPKVVFDPTFPKSNITKVWSPSNDIKETGLPNNSIDMTRIDGILVPLIQINSIVIPYTDIIYMKMSHTSFNPYIEVTILKSQYLKLNTVSLVNKMTVILLPPDDNHYKKISVDFYISSVKDLGDSMRFAANFFYPNFGMKYNKVIKNKDNSGNNKLTTWQLLYNIAAECQLGFASTDMCKTVSDTKIRLMRDQSYDEMIHEHIRFGGDFSNIFDSWIDMWGYLVIANVSWIMSKAINADELSIKQIIGMNIYNTDNFADNPIHYSEDTFRTFTNWKMMPNNSHNYISSYEWIINTNTVNHNGSDNIYYIVDPVENNGGNTILTENIKVEENTADGINYKSVYNFQKHKFLGTEMGMQSDGNTPILFQEQRRDAFMSKLQYKRLKVTLSEMNISLQRGMLVNIIIYEYDRTGKELMMKLIDNLKTSGDLNEYSSDEIEDKQTILDNENFGVPNLSITGIYYIDGIEYIYDGRMSQILYLTKQTRNGNYINFSSVPKIS